MAWESRRDKHYYFRKHKVAGRVVSEYVGTGFDAELAAMLDQQQREQRAAQLAAKRSLQEQQEAIDKEIDFLGNLTRALTGSALLLTGHRQHKRQWRKQRNGDDTN